MSFRVPVPTVSVVDFTALLRREVTVEAINEAHKAAAESGPLAGILQYTEEPLVSTDLKGNPHSSIFSAIDTIGLGSLVKVVAWYDNSEPYHIIPRYCWPTRDRSLQGNPRDSLSGMW